MQSKYKTQKKTIFILIICVGILVLIDIFIKEWIKKNDLQNIGKCSGSRALIHYHPVYNEKGSYINLITSLEYNRIIFLIIAFIGIIFGAFLLKYILKSKRRYGYNMVVIVPEILFIAAYVGRFVERIRGFYTLDYIAIKNVGILDLLDFYFVLGCVGIIVVSMYIQNIDTKQK